MRFGLSLLIGLVCCAQSLAQISVELELEQEQFLRDESLPVLVKVINQSGQTLRLGLDNKWLTFAVLNREGKVVTRLSDVPVTKPFTLKSSQLAKRWADLMPHFILNPGRYQVVATVHIAAWGRDFSTKPARFEIVRGTTVWQRTIGVPRKEGAPEVRRYVIQQARYLKKLVIYARITGESDAKVFGVIPLGNLVTFRPAEYQVDRASNLHVLFQDGPRSFNYSKVNPNGQLILRQRHDYFESRPSLKGTKEGDIIVKGGIRRVMPTDVPARRLDPPVKPVDAPKETQPAPQ